MVGRKDCPLADALHLGPSKLFRPCRVDPMRETPERTVAEGKSRTRSRTRQAGRQVSSYDLSFLSLLVLDSFETPQW